MQHLSPENLIDVAEGAGPEPAHLRECDECRRAVAELRATMAGLAAVPVPEPSPLFWERFAARVHDAVVTEPSPSREPRSLYPAFVTKRVALPLWAAAAAALVFAALITARLGAPHSMPAAPEAAISYAVIPDGSMRYESVASNDPSLAMIAELAPAEGWEDGAPGTLSTHASAADEAVHDLTDGERRELQRLLRNELRAGG